jgi:hypothetical protein
MVGDHTLTRRGALKKDICMERGKKAIREIDGVPD